MSMEIQVLTFPGIRVINGALRYVAIVAICSDGGLFQVDYFTLKKIPSGESVPVNFSILLRSQSCFREKTNKVLISS